MNETRNRLLIANGLNAARVAQYRARLDLTPIPNAAEVRRKWLALEKKWSVLGELGAEVNKLALELICLGIRTPIWDGGLNLKNQDPAVYWDPEADGWVKNESVERLNFSFSQQKEIESYTLRPENRKALRVWNRFVIAFEREPERLYRIRGEGYFAQFRDADGDLLTFPDASLGNPYPALQTDCAWMVGG